MTRRMLWAHFLRRLTKRDLGKDLRRDRGRGLDAGGSTEAWLGRIPTEALQRLARLGVLFPDDFRSRELRALLLRPLCESMEPPEFSAQGPILGDEGTRAEVRAILEAGSLPIRRVEAVMNRLDAAQRP